MQAETKPYWKVTLNNGSRRMDWQVRDGERLGRILAAGGLIDLTCGGKGSCGKCRVQAKGAALPVTAADRRHLSEKELADNVRLACLIQAVRDLELEATATGELRVLTDFADQSAVAVDPVISVLEVSLPLASLEDQRSDLTRFATVCPYRITTPAGLRELEACAAAKEPFYVVHDGQEVLTLSRRKPRLLGLAVDIGTTTLAAYLHDLETGEALGRTSAVNPQRRFGADVIARIHATEQEAEVTAELARLIVERLTEMADGLLSEIDARPGDLYDLAIAGNTIMLHFLLGEETLRLSRAPFTPVFTEALILPAQSLGFPYPGKVSLLPSLSAYIGGDVTAGFLASGMTNRPDVTLYLDLGTNGELALGSREGVVTLSTAAGPAFEGASIACGMASVPGAISEVRIDREVHWRTIADAPPLGLCGTGVIDTVVELLQLGAIDEGGRLLPADETGDHGLASRLQRDERGLFFQLTDEIVFTEKDVREVQLAKAAIRAGIELLLREVGITYADVDRVVVAGGFGHTLNWQQAVRLGLLPEAFADRVESIGNGAGRGAVLYLLSAARRAELRRLLDRARYVELSSSPDFMDEFVERLSFGEDEE